MQDPEAQEEQLEPQGPQEQTILGPQGERVLENQTREAMTQQAVAQMERGQGWGWEAFDVAGAHEEDQPQQKREKSFQELLRLGVRWRIVATLAVLDAA